MEGQVLKDPNTIPVKEVLENALGNSFIAYDELTNTIISNEFDLVPEWRFYKDGCTWLCKVQNKKKTVFWLSVWDKYFKTTFYFTEKNCGGIADLAIDEKIKDNFLKNKPIGKLLPLTMSIESQDQLPDLLKLIEYKKKLK
jgi:hypothetical protein